MVHGAASPLLLLLLAAAAAAAAAFDISQCIAPLGMESGQIPDGDISASSCYNDGNVAPHNGRLNVERQGGAWCPRAQISPEVGEWLQVDLRGVHVVTAVASQGRFGNGQGQEFAEGYTLEYWRPRLGKWVRYRTHRGQEILTGNTNTYLEVKNQLEPAVWASKLRFLPHSTHRRTVCMRVEVYGCPWNAGIVSYAMPPGDTRSNGVVLSDAAYDGAWSGEELCGGLGQLVDGRLGGDDIREAARRSDWVGWRNESRVPTVPRPPPVITFEFDRVREFRSVQVHCNNKFMRDVRAFSSAVVRFSVGGRHYQEEAVKFDNPKDEIFESARNVTIPLHRRIARYVKLELRFAARWLLVSEVAFSSEPAQGNHSAERAPTARARPPRPPRAHPAPAEDPLYVAVLVGVLTSLGILLLVGALVLLHRHRHRKTFTSPLANTSAASTQRRALADFTGTNEKSACEVRSDEYQEPYQALKYASSLCYNTVQLEMEHLRRAATLPLEDSSSYEYAVPEASAAPLLAERRSKRHSHSTHCTANINRLSSCSGGISCGGGSSCSDEWRGGEGAGAGADEVPDLSPHRLRMISKLAEGAFGTVYVAEAEGVPEYGGGGTEGRSLVAVKFLAAEASAEERAAFEHDVVVLRALAHPCLARVVGACRRPPAVVLEYLAGGDLCAHLRRAAPPPRRLHRVVRHLAAGMAYLETLGFVHRDLAARNCLVGAGYTVKIADFGTDNELYARDYVCLNGRTVPLRWAAPEAALEGRHSTRADVWAWAVTVHEVYSLCRRRPYAALSDERVAANLRALFAEGRFEPLPRAPLCPRPLHDLLLRCWRREAAARPAFHVARRLLRRLLPPCGDDDDVDDDDDDVVDDDAS